MERKHRTERSLERLHFWLFTDAGKQWAMFPHLRTRPDLQHVLFRARYWKKKRRWVVAGNLRGRFAPLRPGAGTPFETVKGKAWIVWGGFVRQRLM